MSSFITIFKNLIAVFKKAVFRKYFFKLFALILIFSISFLLTTKFSQSFHFVDEDDHLVFGHFINQGYKLYDNLSSTNHQPLVYLLSSWMQKVVRPKNLFVLVKGGRLLVFGSSFLWALFLVFQFGAIVLPFLLFYELTKFFVLGNLFLLESLVVYPLVYILGENFRIVFFEHKPAKWQAGVYGLANFFIIFNLLPLIPSLFVLNLIYILKTKRLKYCLLGFLFPTVILFALVSPFAWFRETIVYNLKYAIPRISPLKSKADYLTLLLFPFLSFIRADFSIFNSYIQLFSLLLFMGSFIFLVQAKKKEALFFVLFLLAFFLLNNRDLVPGKMYYGGFHLLPWYGALIFFDLMIIKLVFKRRRFWVRFLPFLVLIVWGVILLQNKGMPYFTNINTDREHNVNYYPYYLGGEAIKSVADSDDRLAVFPHESLLYWQSGVRPATSQIVYYDWNYDVPSTKQEIDETFTRNPPEFIYWNSEQVGPASYLEMLESSLASYYWQATREGLAQKLYVKKEKVKSISDVQWQTWEKLGFDKIELEKLNHD